MLLPIHVPPINVYFPTNDFTQYYNTIKIQKFVNFTLFPYLFTNLFK